MFDKKIRTSNSGFNPIYLSKPCVFRRQYLTMKPFKIIRTNPKKPAGLWFACKYQRINERFLLFSKKSPGEKPQPTVILKFCKDALFFLEIPDKKRGSLNETSGINGSVHLQSTKTHKLSGGAWPTAMFNIIHQNEICPLRKLTVLSQRAAQ